MGESGEEEVGSRIIRAVTDTELDFALTWFVVDNESRRLGILEAAFSGDGGDDICGTELLPVADEGDKPDQSRPKDSKDGSSVRCHKEGRTRRIAFWRG